MQAVEPVVVVRGAVARGDVEYARRKVVALLRRVRGPVPAVRVRLTRSADPAVERPFVAQAVVDLDGRPVRAQVAARTAHEAADLLHDRLAGRLERADRHWEARRGGRPLPPEQGREWRHGSVPADRPDFLPRAPADRRVLRHKTFALEPRTVAQAIEDMEDLDFDFHLFREATGGRDCVVHRTPGGVALSWTGDGRPPRPGPAAGVAVDTHPAPRMTVADAQRRLDLTAWPYVVFTDPATGRGAVLYRRYDGHYGLVTARAS